MVLQAEEKIGAQRERPQNASGYLGIYGFEIFPIKAIV